MWINLVPHDYQDGTKPASEVIHTNKKHPFLTVEKGFLIVGQIKLGMHVGEADGQTGVVSGWRSVPGVMTMYNLEVAHDHPYTVGVGMWVVHNAHCVSSITKSTALTKEADRMGNNQQAQREADDLIQKYVGGNTNPGKGTKALFGDIRYLRGYSARVFYRVRSSGVMEILGKSDKGNEQEVINILTKMDGS